jgi:CBS domain-containing protein
LVKPQEQNKGNLSEDADSEYEKYKLNLRRYRTVKDLMTKEAATTTPETRLQEVAKIMGEKHIGSLIVVQNEKPIGIVTERDLLSKVLAIGLSLKDKKVEEVMSSPLAQVSARAKIKKVAQTMISGNSRLGVFNGENLVGVVTASDLIKTLPDASEDEFCIDDFMNKALVLVDEEMPLRAIIDMLGRNRIGSVIVARKGEPFGIFTERDLFTDFLAAGRSLSAKVGPECSSPLVTVPAGTSVHRAAATMALKRIRHLPVVKGGDVVGIITARDLVKVYAK